MRRAVLLLVLLLSAGCALRPRGFDHGRLVRAARVDRERATDAEIAGAIAGHPQISFPFKVAVWFRPAGWWREFRFHWSEEDREAVLDPLRTLTASGTIAQVIPLPDTVVTGDDVRAARLAAARHGAELVLVVTGATEVDRYHNAAAVLYCTVAGLWAVPGTHADGIFFATASLWDVQSGMLLLAVEAKSAFGATGPALLLSNEEVVVTAKRAAVAQLSDDLGVRIANLREPPSEDEQ
jgi:hypothetical protein